MVDGCYRCLACGRENPVKGSNYLNKYCNNQCQQDHRKQRLVQERLKNWIDGCGVYVWKEVPPYVKDYLVEHRGYRCEVCGITEWMGSPPPLTVNQVDGDVYNNTATNLQLQCPNCRAQKNSFTHRKEI